MAQFSAWIQNTTTMKQQQEQSSSPCYITNSKYAEPSQILSWNSEDDTDSDSEPSFYNDSFTSRRHPLAHCGKMHKFQVESPSRATPVAIPARTHDFGWCDRDDERLSEQAACPCGNDCGEFFDGELEINCVASNKCSRSEEDANDFIFDMEM